MIQLVYSSLLDKEHQYILNHKYLDGLFCSIYFTNITWLTLEILKFMCVLVEESFRMWSLNQICTTSFNSWSQAPTRGNAKQSHTSCWKKKPSRICTVKSYNLSALWFYAISGAVWSFILKQRKELKCYSPPAKICIHKPYRMRCCSCSVG